MSEAAPSVTGMDEQLTVREHMMLEFEASWWKYAGAKESRVRETFGVTGERDYQELNALIERSAAAAEYPLVVGRLRRLRERRRASRRAMCTVRRFG